ncbi:MAG: hypothetical protein V4439_04250 [Patescibacteria group bacterium]
MQAENKVCQNCKKDFVIEPNDFGFYEKMGVLPPKICPECRAQLRLSFRNERTFYKRACDKCKKDKVSMYSPNKPYTVWCNDCWNADGWGGEDYAKEYDLNRTFLEQFEELWNVVPRIGLMHVRSVNSEYINISADNKNCYMIVESSNNENCTNCYWIQLSKELVDCAFTNKVELSYEVDDCFDCNNLRFSKGCHSCIDSSFLLDCRGCTSCLGCINLRQQSHCIFNVKYSKEDYENKLKSFRLDTFSGVENFKKEFQNFIKDKPRKFAEVFNVVNSTGNYMTNVKNNHHCFHSYEAEDCRYCVHAWRNAKDNMDCDTVGRVSTNNYQCVNSGQEASNNIVTLLTWGTSFAEYSFHCLGSQELFGCIGMRQKKYCILNKQYSPEEYKILKEKIVNQMKEKGEYGDFFPASLSCFGYNEACVMEQFPLTKEQALEKGFKWEDTPRGTYGKETVDWKNFPDGIKDLSADFDVGKEVFICVECNKNYRIIVDELSFYKRMEIPIPRNCPECRHTRRVKNRGPNKLWHRQCMCEKENHEHQSKCQNEFETSYAPERPEIIYCEQCYQKEVY